MITSCYQTSSGPGSENIWLHHRRLGHPSFSTIKSMFPTLFLKESVESFKCDVCQFAKHHRATYSPSNNKSVHPFDLIHSDVWGPASNSSISGAKWFVTFIDDCTHVSHGFFS